MLLNYNHLYYFHVAAVEGSVAAAAHRLGVRQPTVSEQLRALERALGRDLFERTQAGLRLTESGRVVFQQTCGMYQIGEQIELEESSSNVDELPSLRIGVSGGIARTTKAQFLLPLLSIDGCVPKMRTAESIELLRDLRSGLLDLVVCEREPADSMRRGLHSALIEQTHLVVTARPDLHPASDWHDVELAQFRPTSAYRWEIDAYLREHDLKPRIVVEADDAMLLVESALRRRCIAIVPRAAARDALASGRLSTIAEIDSAETAIHALYQDTSSVRFTRRAVELLVSSSRAVGSGAPS